MFFPTVDIQPVASAYIRAMTELNIWGQITLMRRNIETRRSHLISLTGSILAEIKDLDKVEINLKQDMQNLQVALQYYNEVEETLRKKQTEINELRRNIDELRQHPGITAKSSGASVLHRGGSTSFLSHTLSQSRSVTQYHETPPSAKTIYETLANLKGRPKRRRDIEESSESSDDSIPDTSGAGKTQDGDTSRGNNEVEENRDVEVNEN